jgi:DNA (cytosine-5)-methyltransferase 1
VTLRFVDLFAGLGGFHVGLQRLGHECAAAVEIDPALSDLYSRNFGVQPLGDIRQVKLSDIPPHDILCAGFPCQPFSKAGSQKGLACERNGDLANVVIDWARAARPDYLVLENVANFLKHDKGATWKWFSRELRHAGYSIEAKVLSPHEFGVPQIRERLFVVGSRRGLGEFAWPKQHAGNTHIGTVLDEDPADAQFLRPQIIEALEVWDEFLKAYPRDRRKPWFPVWAAEFGATYPFTTVAPAAVSNTVLRECRGAFGKLLNAVADDELLSAIPPYARVGSSFPAWKVKFLQLNRELYEQNRSWIDPWLPKLEPFDHSFQKFEWNFDRSIRSIWDTISLLRGSGIRA